MAARRLVEHRLKEYLLRLAEERGLARELAEWLYEEHGVRVAAEWRRLRRAVLREPTVTPQELAVFLLNHGVEVTEEEWLSIIRAQSIAGSVPRLPSGEDAGRSRGAGGSPRRRGKEAG